MRLVYSRRAAKEIQRLSPTVRKRVRFVLENLVASPLGGKKLKGPLASYRSLRVGEYRIVYRIARKRQQILIRAVRPRGGAYC